MLDVKSVGNWYYSTARKFACKVGESANERRPVYSTRRIWITFDDYYKWKTLNTRLYVNTDHLWMRCENFRSLSHDILLLWHIRMFVSLVHSGIRTSMECIVELLLSLRRSLSPSEILRLCNTERGCLSFFRSWLTVQCYFSLYVLSHRVKPHIHGLFDTSFEMWKTHT